MSSVDHSIYNCTFLFNGYTTGKVDISMATNFLAGVIANPMGGVLPNDNSFRRYRTTVRSSAVVGGVREARILPIISEVGRATNTVGQAMSSNHQARWRVNCSYPTNSVVAEDFSGFARKYSNFAATFEYSSLAGVAERLAKAIACVGTIGDMDSGDIRGNAPLHLSALGTHDGPVTSMNNSVFIPRLVSSLPSPDVFSVLVNAIAGEGGMVVTDVLELDAVTRQPIIPVAQGHSLVSACVDALRIVGTNMAASDQGPLFAYAVTKGIHHVVSVVGHTDEGGTLREVLRAGNFDVPFGGIHYGLEEYTGLPALHYNNDRAVAAYCDAIALTTAGVVAHCDPGMTYDGRLFPYLCIGTESGSPITRPGDSTTPEDAMAARNRAQLLSSAPKFISQYAMALAKIFGCLGSTELVERHFCAAINYLPPLPRHLRYATVTPYFWIEPTGLIPHDFLGTPAELAQFGSYGGKGVTRAKSAWESITCVSPPDPTFSSYIVDMTTPRRSWFLLHWHGHPQDGLSALKVRQMDPNLIIQPGSFDPHQQVRDRVEADCSIDQYLWVRGQSPFCAPGEMMNLGGTVGIFLRHSTYDDDGLPHIEHLPAAHEMLDLVVEIHVGHPTGISIANSNWGDAGVRRSRTRASNELQAVARRVKLFGRTDVLEMATSYTAPRGQRRDLEADADVGGGQPNTRYRNLPVRGTGHTVPRDREGDGTPLTATPHHQPVRAPQLPRQPQQAVPINAGPNVVPNAPVLPQPPVNPPNGPDDNADNPAVQQPDVPNV